MKTQTGSFFPFTLLHWQWVDPPPPTIISITSGLVELMSPGGLSLLCDLFFSPLQHNPSHIYTQKHSTPHGNDSLINPISSGCLPTQWCCQRRQVTEDAFRFVMKISPMCVKLCCRSWCYRITWTALKRNVTIVELIVIHCSEFIIQWP